MGMTLFVRTCSRPRRDLARGYSYSMGEFGNEEQAHTGLSGYSLDRGTEDAVEALAERMGVSGRFERRGAHRRIAADAVTYVAVYEGRDAGTGPDGEELFRPSRLVAAWKTREIAGVEEVLERLAALGVEG